MLNTPVDCLPVIGDWGWNLLASGNPIVATVSWWLALLLVGWAAWPLCLRVCRGLPDRGYLAAKAVGWLVAGYTVWLGASNRWLANRTPHIYAAVAVLCVVGACMAYRQRRLLAALWRARRWLVVLEELLFSGAFLAFVLVRALNPDLWQPWFGGEKMMELAYLNAIVKSAHFPPYDPYFAGGHINYYYYGLYLVNVLIKLTGIVPHVAFNLAVPTFFALTVGLAFSCGHALTATARGRRWLWGGLAAAAGVAVLANLTVLVQWLSNLVAMGGGNPHPESGLEAAGPLLAGLGRWLTLQGGAFSFDYWYQATRVIPFTINEFPFFSFLFADLHPHMMSIPFTLTVLALAIGISGLLRALPSLRASAYPAYPGSLVLLALAVGALGPLNTWDLPAYLGLVALILIWGEAGCRRLWRGMAEAAVVTALAYALYLPFYTHFAAPAAGLRLLPNRTPLRYFGVVWGLWLVVLYGWLLPRWWRGEDGAGRWLRLRTQGRWPRARRLLRAFGWRLARPDRLRRLVLAAGLVLSLVATVAGELPVALLLPLAALAGDLWLREGVGRGERTAGLLALVGCLILGGIELVYLADFLQGTEWYRMNTMFKFGIQAWVLLALAAAGALPGVLEWLREGWMRGREAGVLSGLANMAASERGEGPGVERAAAPGRGRRLVYALVVVGLCGVSLAYVPLGLVARVNERFPEGPAPRGTLDGMAYMLTGVYSWPDTGHRITLRHDYEAIQWLLEHVQGTPVIAEAPLGYYREGGMRVSSYTGLPTLLGAHQVEQRQPERAYERQGLAEELYETLDIDRTLALLRELRVQYVYVGQLEEIAYGPEARAKFDDLVRRGEAEIAFRNAGVTIYRIVGGLAPC